MQVSRCKPAPPRSGFDPLLPRSQQCPVYPRHRVAQDVRGRPSIVSTAQRRTSRLKLFLIGGWPRHFAENRVSVRSFIGRGRAPSEIYLAFQRCGWSPRGWPPTAGIGCSWCQSPARRLRGNNQSVIPAEVDHRELPRVKLLLCNSVLDQFHADEQFPASKITNNAEVHQPAKPVEQIGSHLSRTVDEPLRLPDLDVSQRDRAHANARRTCGTGFRPRADDRRAPLALRCRS